MTASQQTRAMAADLPALSPELTNEERDEVRNALARIARGRGIVVRGVDLLATGIGSLAGLGLRRLKIPDALDERMTGLAMAVLARAFDVATLALDHPLTAVEQRRLTASVIASGALGGAAGLAGFVPDATMTTLAILRAIASEALQQGESLEQDSTQRACLEVFLLQDPELQTESAQPSGSPDPHPRSDQPAKFMLSYPAARLLLRGQPLALLIREAAAQYGIALSQKLVTQSIPIIGAAAGATLNSAFLAHYRDMARAHFTLRRIARRHRLILR